MNQVFRIICSRRLPIGLMPFKVAVAATALSTPVFVCYCGLMVPVFAQAPATKQASGSSGNAPSGLLGATEAQAKPLKGAEQFVGSIIEKRNAFTVKGVHESIEIPSNFPVPTYPNHVSSTNFVTNKVGAPVASVFIITSDGPKTTYDWYQKRCSESGWSVSSPPDSAKVGAEKNGSLFRMSAFKDGQQLVFSFMKMKKSPKTVITINWILKSKLG
jgi:hypothetical protein